MLLSGVSTVFSQGAKSNEADYFQSDLQQSQMRKLDALIGKWTGEGWILRGAEREEFVGTETVQKKINGLALLVEGRFTRKTDTSHVIHETLAILSFNPKTKEYEFKAHLASGSSNQMKFDIVGEAFEWGIEFPGNKILYTITINDGMWKEVGNISRDGGKTWTQFFEMNLKKP